VRGDLPLFRNTEARHEAARYNAQALRLGWKRAAASVGLEHVTMYPGSKHSTLTEARRRGVSLDQLQHAAGHKDPRSTAIYAELAQEDATKVLRLARKRR
jgi:integrase